MSVKVQNGDFDIGEELSKLTKYNTGVGGVASFVGFVRDVGGGDTLRAMTLEHYPGMTEKLLAEIEAEANIRWKLEASLIIHRYGRLKLGDRIVLVATASAHRQVAFEACLFLVDWLKTRAPFWKMEDTVNTGSRWVKAKEADVLATKRWQLKDQKSKFNASKKFPQ